MKLMVEITQEKQVYDLFPLRSLKKTSQKGSVFEHKTKIKGKRNL